MQINLFAEEMQLERLSKLGDSLERLKIIDFESFRPTLTDGLKLGEKVPDAKTIWLFRNTLTESGIIENLFSQFNRMLEERGIITHKGTIVDATFVDAPRQRKSLTNWHRKIPMPVGQKRLSQ